MPSPLTAISRFVAPAGLCPTTVPGSAVRVPVAAIANPEIVEEPALEKYAKRPSGVTATQQFAAPRVGALAVIDERVPLDWIA